ncbi:MAG: hypothetical protein ACR2PM_07660 [Hyphomicrobiales bacterium]
MAIQTLSALAVRITGIVIGLSALKAGAAYLYTAAQANLDPWLFLALTPTVMMFAAAACMIVFPRTVAGNLVPVVANETREPPAIGQLEVLGCALIGLYFLIQAVLDATWMISYYYAGRQWDTAWVWNQSTVTPTVVAAAKFAIAVWLLLGAKGLFGLLRWARRVHAD